MRYYLLFAATLGWASLSAQLRLIEHVYFDYGKDVLKKESIQTLDTFLQATADLYSYRLQIVGHADSVGTFEFNDSLGMRRAKRVFNYLVARGVSSQNIFVTSSGEYNPVSSNGFSEGRLTNRRVTLILDETILYRLPQQPTPPAVTFTKMPLEATADELPAPKQQPMTAPPTKTEPIVNTTKGGSVVKINPSGSAQLGSLARYDRLPNVFHVYSHRDTVLASSKGTRIYLTGNTFKAAKPTILRVEVSEIKTIQEAFTSKLFTVNQQYAPLESLGAIKVTAVDAETQQPLPLKDNQLYGVEFQGDKGLFDWDIYTMPNKGVWSVTNEDSIQLSKKGANYPIRYTSYYGQWINLQRSTNTPCTLNIQHTAQNAKHTLLAVLSSHTIPLVVLPIYADQPSTSYSFAEGEQVEVYLVRPDGTLSPTASTVVTVKRQKRSTPQIFNLDEILIRQ